MEPRWVWAATVNFNSNLTAEYSTGIATISSPDTNYWSNTNAGINTTASVGIGTTNPTTKTDCIWYCFCTTFAGNITGTGATFTTSDHNCNGWFCCYNSQNLVSTLQLVLLLLRVSLVISLVM